MRVYRYCAWDGSQDEFRLDPDDALDALSALLMEGLSLRAALDAMAEHGFALAGRELRVLGRQDLLRALRDEARALERRYHLRAATESIRRRLDALLDLEQTAVRARHGHESARHNDFMARRHAEPAEPGEPLSGLLDRFRDWAFEDATAGEAFAELLAELERLRALERFRHARGERFRGPEPAGYETAQEIRERLEALSALAQALADGDLPSVDSEALRALLGSEAADSLILLRDL